MNNHPPPPTNRLAQASAVAAVLALLSFCVGVAPIPMTAWLCYPSAVVLGIGAMLAGFKALGQLRNGAERGRRLALAGIWTGGAMIAAVICFTTLTALLLWYGIDAIKQLGPQFGS